MEKEIKLKTPYHSKLLIHRQIKPENIKFSEAKILVVQDKSKVVRWPNQYAGNCTLEAPMLYIVPEGYFTFSGNLSSSGSDDSWGIHHFDFKQANHAVIFTSGPFWGPTIVGHEGPWEFSSTYPAYMFDWIEFVSFESSC